MNSYNKNIGS